MLLFEKVNDEAQRGGLCIKSTSEFTLFSASLAASLSPAYLRTSMSQNQKLNRAGDVAESQFQLPVLEKKKSILSYFKCCSSLNFTNYPTNVIFLGMNNI